jgi:hypothetical protein
MDVTKALKKLNKDLKDPNSRASKHLKQFGKDLLNKQEKRIKFFETKKFKDRLKEIHRHDSVHEEELRYKVCPEVKMDAKEFMEVYDAIWETLGHKVIDETDYFKTEYIPYKGYRWYMMIGQGTACWCVKEKVAKARNKK